MPWAIIIEPDAELRETFRFVLEDEGYDVLDTAHGAAGLKLLRVTTYRAVALLNHVLPWLDSGDILRAVAKDPALQRHAYVIVTASPQRFTEEDLAIQRVLGVPVIATPFDLDVLLVAIARATWRLSGP
jgi:CheY-like chemotaxis protein